MSSSKRVPDILILRAALVRLSGGSWTEVGQAVSRSKRRVAHWPVIFRVQWEQAVTVVEPAIMLEAAAEGMLTLRRLARSDDIKVRLNAASRILSYRVAMLRILRTGLTSGPLPVDSEWVRMARLMEGQTDDEIEALLARRPAIADKPGGDV